MLQGSVTFGIIVHLLNLEIFDVYLDEICDFFGIGAHTHLLMCLLTVLLLLYIEILAEYTYWK